MRTSRTKRGRGGRATLFARLTRHITLQVQPDGEIFANVQGHPVRLGKFSKSAAARAQNLRAGLPLSSFESDGQSIDKEIHTLIGRLAIHGLLEYRLARSQSSEDLVVIEPQLPDYWPRMPPLPKTGTFVLSRFAYMRRRDREMVLESPRAGALFRICDPNIATALAILSAPHQIAQLRRQNVFPEVELLALLIDCQIVFEVEAGCDGSLRRVEGDDELVLWDFHDLLFHTRSSEGRHANPSGGVSPYAGTISPLPAIRPRWPGKKIALRSFSAAQSESASRTATLLRQRHSSRIFDDLHPLTIAELSRFLEDTAPVLSRSKVERGVGGPLVAFAVRPYPSAGACYELELYLAVNECEGLTRGFYHYDAGAHALVPIEVRGNELDALLMRAAFAIGAPAAPQIVITIAARFGRVSWKYASIAYALILKDVGVLIQTFYMIATEMGLGGCAIGIANIDLFAKMTGIEFHVEGPVGQFAIGRRGVAPDGPDLSTLTPRVA